MRKLILASLTISSTLAAQAPGGPPRTTPLRGSLERRLAQLLDVPPFERATWGLYVVDDRARVLYQRNADRFAVPASNTKLVVTAAATVLLPPDYRVTTSLYVNGRVDAGVLHGDLVLYGRGDPTWSQRCYSVDTLAPGACDSAFTAIDAIADSVRARGLRRITGKLVGDGSYFEPTIVHPGWNAWDLNWWYAAPVSGLGFHDNSVDFKITPGPAVDTPPVITWSPDLALFTFENRARTVPADSSSTIGDNFFRKPGTPDIWAEGTVALGRKPTTGHHRFARLPRRPLLRAARRVPRPAAPGHPVPNPQHEPELVRRDVAQDSGPGAQRRGVVGGGARRRAAVPRRFGEARLHGVRARGRLGARRGEPGDAARLRAAPRLHAPPSQARAVPRRVAALGATRLAAQALRGHTARDTSHREDGEHRPRQQPVGLHRAPRRPDHHVQHSSERARGAISADAGPDRFDCRGDWEDRKSVV